MYTLSIIFTFSVYLVVCIENKITEDKLILSPAELIRLVVEEQKKKHPPGSHNEFTTMPFRRAGVKETKTTSEESDDGDTLTLRKIWSRWSKWGDCSVTCGDGTITRRRLCVAGRCSPGECEEQRRHCTRSPCPWAPIPIDTSDELHDFD